MVIFLKMKWNGVYQATQPKMLTWPSCVTIWKDRGSIIGKRCGVKPTYRYVGHEAKVLCVTPPQDVMLEVVPIPCPLIMTTYTMKREINELPLALRTYL